MHDWTKKAQAMIAGDGWTVLVTVSAVHGSVPREAGTKMLVGPTKIIGTIGGGALEHRAIQLARRAGASDRDQVRELDVPLGPKAQQCCGGRVELLMERLDGGHLDMLSRIDTALKHDESCHMVSSVEGESPLKEVVTGVSDDTVIKTDRYLTEPIVDNRPWLYLFGAGHVGQAIVARMADLPFRIVWIDSRAEMFPEDVPDNVEISISTSSSDMVSKAPPGSAFLVMTYSHPIDYAVTAAILARGDSAYCGLIGSKTKRARFLKRFGAEEGLSASDCARLTCPIGVPSISGKAPGIVAIGVIAQLLETFSA